MPITWTIAEEERLMVAVLGDSTTAQKVLDLLGTIIERNVMPFRKIFDASRAQRWLQRGQLEPVTATVRLYSQMKLGPIGPLAVVTGNPGKRCPGAGVHRGDAGQSPGAPVRAV